MEREHLDAQWCTYALRLPQRDTVEEAFYSNKQDLYRLIWMKIQNDQYWLTRNNKLRWISSPDTWRPKGRPAVYRFSMPMKLFGLLSVVTMLIPLPDIAPSTIYQVVSTQVVYAPWGMDAEPSNNEWKADLLQISCVLVSHTLIHAFPPARPSRERDCFENLWVPLALCHIAILVTSTSATWWSYAGSAAEEPEWKQICTSDVYWDATDWIG